MPALTAPQAGETDRRAQFERTGSLLVGDGDRRAETSLDFLPFCRWQTLQEITPQPMQLGVSPFCATYLRRCQCLGENRQRLVDCPGLGERLSQQTEKPRFVEAPPGRLRCR